MLLCRLLHIAAVVVVVVAIVMVIANIIVTVVIVAAASCAADRIAIAVAAAATTADAANRIAIIVVVVVIVVAIASVVYIRCNGICSLRCGHRFRQFTNTCIAMIFRGYGLLPVMLHVTRQRGGICALLLLLL